LIDSLLVPNGVLGHSATAVVEKVRCKRIVLARKKIRCNWRLKREDAIEEVAHLQRLSHAHVIRVVGTYVVGKELSILLYPATEHNLESFLDEYAELSPGNTLMPRKNQARFWMEEGMSQFPTCLVHAIHFVHGQLVKHMDVKPTNLLVQRKVRALETSYKIYLADFGIARSYNTAADAETESRTPFSRTYAAPEVIRQDKRGFSADIFSLGCVLLEIYAAWVGRRAEFNDLRRQNSDGDVSYQANMEGLEGYIHSVRGRGQIEIPQSFIHGNRYSVWTMMHHDPHCRPTAEELVQAHDIFRPASCCTAGPEPFRAENSLKNNR
jgi:serine/threonine protein kinase